MHGLRSKAAAAAIVALLGSLPADEGGVTDKGSYPYVDIAGVRTVCYGHTGKDIEMRWYSKQECESILEKDIVKHMKRVESCTPGDVPRSMLAGFTSFDFNTGSFCSSRANREYKAGRLKESCRALAYSPSGSPVWSYIKGGTVFVKGLFDRRVREMNACLKDL